MNAIKFIQDNGVDKAREVVSGAPDGATHFVGSTYLKLIGAVWWNAWLPEWSHKDNCMVKKWKCESIELMKTWGEVYKLEDLKRLVESSELVEHFGNDLVGAKQLLEFSKDCKTIELSGSVITVERLEQAIADYESIGGEHV